MCKQLFEEIEERKHYFERLDAAYKRKKRHEQEKQAETAGARGGGGGAGAARGAGGATRGPEHPAQTRNPR